MNFQPFALAALIAVTGLAQAQSVPSTTTLNFASVNASTSLSFSNVIGAINLTITPQTTSSSNTSSQLIVVSDLDSTEGAAQPDKAIGVQVYKTTPATNKKPAKKEAVETAYIDKNESLLFTFSQVVKLTGFNMDYASGAGSKLFTLSVDGGVAQRFTLNGSNFATAGLSGKTFQFGTLTSDVQPYAIDSVSLASITVSTPTGGGVVAAVPEPETYALMAACLGVLAVVTRRRQA